MRLDEIGLGGAAGFDGVGIDGALAENPVAVEKMPGLEDALLHVDELLADDVALLLRLGDAGQCAQELPAASSTVNASAPSEWNRFADEFGLAFAHQAGIDVDAADARPVPSARRHSV